MLIIALHCITLLALFIKENLISNSVPCVIYPEVEQPAVVLIKHLLKRNNLLKDVILECQSAD